MDRQRKMEQIPGNKALSFTRIDSLTGLKAVALLFIFWWHAPVSKPDFDIGAQMCQLLFICSGFLTGYSSLKKPCLPAASWKDPFKICLKKLKAFWPLHALFTLLWLVFLSDTAFTPGTAIKLILNLLLLQAWHPAPDVYMSFNGVSWFLSALLFCYFLSPFLLKTIRRGRKCIILAFVAAFLARIILNDLCWYFPKTFSWFNTYSFPPIRVLEFYLGILIVPLYKHFDAKIRKMEEKKRTLIMTVAELSYVLALEWFLFFVSNKVSHSLTPPVYLPLIILFACNTGLISKFLALKPFRLFGKIQFQFFIVHHFIIRIFLQYNILENINIGIRTILMLIAAIAVSSLLYLLHENITKRILK